VKQEVDQVLKKKAKKVELPKKTEEPKKAEPKKVEMKKIEAKKVEVKEEPRVLRKQPEPRKPEGK